MYWFYSFAWSRAEGPRVVPLNLELQLTFRYNDWKSLNVPLVHVLIDRAQRLYYGFTPLRGWRRANGHVLCLQICSSD
jgi:hypothetical protein